MISSPFFVGNLELPNRLIQGPLAGVSAAPFRRLFYQFVPPAYVVTEMISAQEVLTRHMPTSRYLYRAPEEKRLCYQLAGTDPTIISEAASKLEALGSDLIDINCGCPKMKIRKKGAGSALMDTPEKLLTIVEAVRHKIRIPLTVKLRIYHSPADVLLAKRLEEAGADALIIHGRCWTDDYQKPCNFEQISAIKAAVQIPVIANGDIKNLTTLAHAVHQTHADAYMISRAGCGRPWLYQELLTQKMYPSDLSISTKYFLEHLEQLCLLEPEHLAIMQSRGFVRYYFRNVLNKKDLEDFYQFTRWEQVKSYLLSDQFKECVAVSIKK